MSEGVNKLRKGRAVIISGQPLSDSLEFRVEFLKMAPNTISSGDVLTAQPVRTIIEGRENTGNQFRESIERRKTTGIRVGEKREARFENSYRVKELFLTLVRGRVQISWRKSFRVRRFRSEI